MPSKNKIEGLTKNISVCEAAEIILKNKYSILLKRIKKYLKQNNEENLHSLRIAVRRFRYTFESFEICFKKNETKKFYATVKNLQDVLGKERDIDVIKSTLLEISKQNKIQIPENLIENLNEQKQKINKEIINDLIEFKEDKKFYNIINK